MADEVPDNLPSFPASGMRVLAEVPADGHAPADAVIGKGPARPTAVVDRRTGQVSGSVTGNSRW